MFSALPLRARPTASSGVQWLRFDDERGRFLPDTGRAPLLAVERSMPLRMTLEGFHPAVSGGVAALDIHALFDRGDGEHWRFLAWHYRNGDPFGSSRGSGFDLEPGAACCLEFAIKEQASAVSCMQTLDLTCAAGLEPGRYLVAITGMPFVSELPFGGDWSRPLGKVSPFDHLLVRVDRRLPVPDLALRADLACSEGYPGEAQCIGGGVRAHET